MKDNAQNRLVAILRRLSARYEAALERKDFAAIGRINGRYHRLHVERHLRTDPNADFHAPAHLAARCAPFNSQGVKLT